MKQDGAVPGLRKCRKCGQEKNVSEFRPDKANNGRRYARHQCRACENDAWRSAWLAGKKGRQSATVLAVKAPIIVSKNGQGVEAQLEESVKLRMIRYGSDALDALHDLAMMPISIENSMLNQVKLAAAKLLAGSLLTPDATSNAGGFEKTLHDLNELYHREAPRIKAIRERIISFEPEPVPTTDPEQVH